MPTGSARPRRGQRTVLTRSLPVLLVLVALAGARFAGAAVGAAAPAAPTPPRLVFQAEPGAEGARRQLEGMDPARLEGALRLSGLADGGPPIRVQVVPEHAALARRTPPWIAGFASGTSGPVVLFPARAQHYPYDSLEELLQHEVAHVLINRAAAGRPVPRWLHEGIALTAGERWGLEDRGRFALEVARGGAVPLASLDRMFAGSEAQVGRAYAVAGSFVNDLLREHGPDATGTILAGLAEGRSVEEAFRLATGESLRSAEERFWRRQTFWNRWLPLLSSSTVLWIGVTVLALMAIRRRRRRDAELAAHWEEEEQARAAALARPVGGGGRGSSGPGDEGAPDGDQALEIRDDSRREWIH